MGHLIRPVPAPPPILCLELQSRRGLAVTGCRCFPRHPSDPRWHQGCGLTPAQHPNHSLLGGACPPQRRQSHFSPQQGRCLENNPTSTCPYNARHMVSDADCHTSRFTSRQGQRPESVAENRGGPLQYPLQANFMLLLSREQHLL